MEDSRSYLFDHDGMASIFVFQTNPQIRSFKRITYNELDMVGDIGGLYNGLRLVFTALMFGLNGFEYTSLLASKLFYVGKGVD